MIIDNLLNAKKYYHVHKNFKSAFEAIEKFAAENAADGKYVLDGDNLYASVQTYNSKLKETRDFEYHNKYIDIQYIISGDEEICIANLNGTQSSIDFNEQRDVGYVKMPKHYNTAHLTDGYYAVMFPDEAHLPGCATDDAVQEIRKIVVKVLL